MQFHEILKDLISEWGLTQKQVAQDLKIPVSTLGNYAQGISQPDFEMLKAIAKYFGTTPNYLLGIPSRPATTFKEEELLRTFRALSPAQQDIYLEQGRAFIKINAREKVY